jgi:hypothetical protein
VTLKSEGTAVLCNVWNHLASDTVSHLGRPESTATLLLEPQVLQDIFVTVNHFFFVFVGILKLKYVQANGCNRSSGARAFSFVQVSTDFGTNMTGVGL